MSFRPGKFRHGLQSCSARSYPILPRPFSSSVSCTKPSPLCAFSSLSKSLAVVTFLSVDRDMPLLFPPSHIPLLRPSRLISREFLPLHEEICPLPTAGSSRFSLSKGGRVFATVAKVKKFLLAPRQPALAYSAFWLFIPAKSAFAALRRDTAGHCAENGTGNAVKTPRVLSRRVFRSRCFVFYLPCATAK